MTSIKQTVSDNTQPEWHKWAIALTASFGAILEVIDTNIVNVALNPMQNDLDATISEMSWVVTGYVIANVIIIPLTAWLGDYFGKKTYFIFSLVGFTIASVLCGFAVNLPMLAAARILQGLCGGGLLAKAQAILFETFPPHQHGQAQAVFGMGIIIGPAIAPTLGGWLTDTLSWRWIFFVNLPIGIVAVLMAQMFLPGNHVNRKSVSHRVDWLGIGLLTVTIISFQTLLVQGEKHDWFASGFICTLGMVSLIGLVLLIWRELSTKSPAVDLRILRHRSLAVGSLYAAVISMGFYSSMYAVPLFAQGILHFSATQTGMLLFPGVLASAVLMPLVGQITKWIAPRWMIAIGSIIISLVMFQLARVGANTSRNDLFYPLLWQGVGAVMMLLPLSLATLGTLPKPDIAAGSGFYNLSRHLGSSIGIALLTTLLVGREAFHRTMLAVVNPLQEMYSANSLEQAIHTQAQILAFEDIFSMIGTLFLMMLPLTLLLGKQQPVRK
jgi:DHA2 family multidrug resistance protein